MTAVTDADIEAFLSRYETSLSHFDAEASAALWGLPGTIMSDDFAGSLDSRELMAQGLQQAHPMYQALGLNRVTHTLMERGDVTQRIVRLRVRWHFHSGDEHLTDGDYEYLLRRDDAGLRAYVAVAIDETEKLIALAKARGVDLSQFTTPGLVQPHNGYNHRL